MATVDADLGEPAGTLAELLEGLGNVPLERILARPAPGTATEHDLLILLHAANKRLCELIDGVLVEKPRGTAESLLAGYVLHLLWDFLRTHNLGRVLGADGALRLMPGLVRLPDVSFLSWQRLPDGLPTDPIASVIPDLAIEVISASNTRGEIQRKLRDYFVAGVRLVWVIHPTTESAEIYTAPDEKTRIGKTGSLEGGDVLPGFSLPLADLFAELHAKPPGR